MNTILKIASLMAGASLMTSLAAAVPDPAADLRLIADPGIPCRDQQGQRPSGSCPTPSRRKPHLAAVTNERRHVPASRLRRKPSPKMAGP
jgi:hypothetical protein